VSGREPDSPYASWHAPAQPGRPWRDWLLRQPRVNPLWTALFLPWFLWVAPLLFVSADGFAAAGGASFVDTMRSIVPMIDKMARLSPAPAWTRMALAILWGTLPLGLLLTIWLLLAARVTPAAPPSDTEAGFTIKGVLFVAGLLLLAAVSEPRPWRRFDVYGPLFATRLGFTLAGWLLVHGVVVMLGAILAAALDGILPPARRPPDVPGAPDRT
jgi:hypothetical protein